MCQCGGPGPAGTCGTGGGCVSCREDMLAGKDLWTGGEPVCRCGGPGPVGTWTGGGHVGRRRGPVGRRGCVCRWTRRVCRWVTRVCRRGDDMVLKVAVDSGVDGERKQSMAVRGVGYCSIARACCAAWCNAVNRSGRSGSENQGRT